MIRNLVLLKVAIIFISNSTSSWAQETSIQVKGEPVRMTSILSRALWVSDNFFDPSKNQIIAQIGEKEFEFVQAACQDVNWPEPLRKWNIDLSLLNKLKVYWIATFDHYANGKSFGKYVILRIPFHENKEWDNSVTWTGNIYFLMKEEHIETIK